MGKGHGKARTTLGDAADSFLAQWKAVSPKAAATAMQPRSGGGRGTTHSVTDPGFCARNPSGDEVEVTKGVSKGYKKRTRPSVAPPAPKEQVVADPVAIVIPPPPRAEPPVTTPPKLPLHQRLAECSANVADLQISAAMSRPRHTRELPPVSEDDGGRLAILGLDFGTAFTKAVVRWSGRHYAVDWSDAVEGEDHHLLASVFSEAADGRCILGAKEGAGWSIHQGIKLQLLSASQSTGENLVDAVTFIALAFRHVNHWLRESNLQGDSGIRWRLHVGLPTKSWDNDATTDTFKTVAQAARVLACKPGAMTRVAAAQALKETAQVERPAVDVFPEFACQLYSYLDSPERADDLHALVDVGAGTVDVAYFNVFISEGEKRLPIFASGVEKLGAHYLIAALSGAGGGVAWRDGESSLTNEEVARKVGCTVTDVNRRRSIYLSTLANMFNEATSEAKKTYPSSPAFRSGQYVRLFLCGGGSRIPAIKERFDRIAGEASKILDIRFQVAELVRPQDIVGEMASGFDRLSVAYGLSQIAANIGNVMRSATLQPVMPVQQLNERDRDEDR